MTKKYIFEEIIKVMEQIAPPERAEEWDHIGLMIGNKKDIISGIVLSLDVRSEAIDLCIKTGANLIITHHPLFFTPLFSIDTQTPEGMRVARLMEERICVYSAHTNLDRADYGVNHALGDFLSLSTSKEIAHNDYALYATLESKIGVFEFARKVADLLCTSGIFLNTSTNRPIQKLCLFAGSFDEKRIPELIENHTDAVLTGEIKHHASLLLHEAGIACIQAGHEATERYILPFLEKKLKEAFPNIDVHMTQGIFFEKRICGQFDIL